MTGLNITTSSNNLVLASPSDNPVTISIGVTIGGATGSALTSPLATYWTIANYSTIAATAAGSDGILLTHATINNSLLGGITGAAAGVSLTGSGSVTNRSTIAATQASGTGYSYRNGNFTALSAGVILGGGGIYNTAFGTITSPLEGVVMGGGGSVVNGGSIDAARYNPWFRHRPGRRRQRHQQFQRHHR